MMYVKVVWFHESSDEPVLYFSEIDDDRCETRKVQVYRDGRPEWASEDFETATVGLAEIPFPPLEEISSKAEFIAEEIAPEEFDRAWIEARSGS
ncbi:DUF6881 domain-containing protein [Nocardiopsis sp. NPDC058631]|uniref:DUF6881 domain-containing protein n=1 Tax=Nocardiopsis sp. NPDC058631 TaxID=3346566 RepID=UPI00364DFADE